MPDMIRWPTCPPATALYESDTIGVSGPASWPSGEDISRNFPAGLNSEE